VTLFPEHAALLEASAISSNVAAERVYHSVPDTERGAELLERYGFSPAQRNLPGLLLPVWGVGGSVVARQLRSDRPRENGKGKPVRYETPLGTRMVLDAHPFVRPSLGDPKVELWLTEGIRKADSAISHGLLCVALLGVWNWRGTNEQGGRAALACFESIALNARRVFVAYDSDAERKPEVGLARERLAAFLESRGACVSIVRLPETANGEKTGLDDFFARGGRPEELERLAVAWSSAPTASAPAEKSWVYAQPLVATTISPHVVQFVSEDVSAELDKRQFHFLSPRELVAGTSEETPWIAKPWIVRGALTEVTGKIKASGKTTWVLECCKSIIDGLPFLGEATERVPVVYLSEQNRTSYVQALRRAGLAERHDEMFRAICRWDLPRQTSWEEVVAIALAEVVHIGAGVLVVDTVGSWAKFKEGQEDDSAATMERLEPLLAAADSHQLGQVIARHDRKGSGEVGESGRGSSAFSGAMDIIVKLRRRDRKAPSTHRVIETLGRFDELPENLIIDLTLHGYVTLGSEEEASAAEAKRKILEELGDDSALSYNELAERTEVARTTVQQIVKAALREGELHQVGGKDGLGVKGVKGHPLLFQTTAPSEELFDE
jgi:hypothetical protein